MPKYCSVFGCNASSGSSDESFFQYPSESNARRSWIARVRREGFTPTTTSYVCSRHFSNDQFSGIQSDTPGQFRRKRLKKGAIPDKNLRGNSVDERLPKRTTFVSSRASASSPAQSVDADSESGQLPSSSDTPAAVGMFLNENLDFGLDETERHFFEMKSMKDELKKAGEKIAKLQKNCFLFNNLSDADVLRYTGLQTSIFNSLVGLIDRFSPVNYWSGSAVVSVTKEDQLLIFLMKLKLDLPYFDLARRFLISQTTVQNIFMTYLHLIHEILFTGMINKIPTLEKNKCSLPESFGDFANCRVIIDCTEFRISVPRKDLGAAASSFSNYKHYLTGKFLIGVAPNGTITYVSNGFPGSTSDKAVTKESGILHHLQAGDLILADKGFLIHDLLPKNVFLNLPAFLAGKSQFTKEEATFSRKIAACRIHVERAIGRIRNYKIVHLLTAPLRPFADKIIQVCAALVDLQSPIIAGVFDNYSASAMVSDLDSE